MGRVARVVTHRSRLPLAVAACAGILWMSAGVAWAATSSPNDYFFTQGDQWSLSGSPASINAPAAWCVATGAGVTIADVDTGADFAHQDLAGKLIGGAAFLGGTGAVTGTGPGAVSDGLGHGTMTTGIMVADTNNGLGVASVAPDARALVVKVLNDQGQGYDQDVAAGIRWAAANGAQVINLSLGPDLPILQTGATSPIAAAIHQAYADGVAVAIAAGNSGIDASPQAVAQFNGEALVVGAVGPGGDVASYSNSTVGVSVYAPGGDAGSTGMESVQNSVLSTYFQDSTGGTSDGYAYGDGTSFATPMVAGVLAQLRQLHPGWSVSQLFGQVTGSAVTRHGVPELDAARAVGSTGTCAAGTSPAHPAGVARGTAGSAHGGGTVSPGAPSPVATASSGSPGGAAAPSPGASPPGPASGRQPNTLAPAGPIGEAPNPPPPSAPLIVGAAIGACLTGGALLVRRMIVPRR